jgi:hypothetical protein
MASRHNRIGTVEEFAYAHINAVAASRTQLNTTPANGAVLDYGHGAVLQRIVIGDPGATQVLTIYDGNTATVVAVVKPSSAGFIDFGVTVPGGIWFTLSAGTVGDFTLVVLPLAA